MPIVAFHSLVYVTPDGRTLFDGLDLVFGRERIGLIGRNGIGKSTLLDIALGRLPPTGGHVTATGDIRILEQQIDPAPDLTIADAFGVREALLCQAKALAGQAAEGELAELDWTLDARLSAALEEVGLGGMAPDRPLQSLSGGQRTRAALAALTFGDPDLILLDEPTNNLDREGRVLVGNVLERFRGGVVVVSHDRPLLRQMDRLVELSDRGYREYGGNYDFYAMRKAEERAAAERRLSDAERDARRTAQQTRIVRERKARSDAGGRRQRSTGSQGKMLLDARQNRAEKTLRRTSRVAERQKGEASDALETARTQFERVHAPVVEIGSSGLPAAKTVLTFDKVTGGWHADHPLFRDVSFTIVGPERVAVTGANGSGKSTLLRLAAGAIAPLSGRVLQSGRVAMLDQEVALLDPDASLLENFHRLNPHDGGNACRSALARFLFRADAALGRVGDLSGGEKLRAGLACVLGGQAAPTLLVLDEPTNHLDLPALEAVENGLKLFDGALLVASHDADFLEAIGVQRHMTLPW